MLTFLERREMFSVYQHPDGRTANVPHRLFFGELDVDDVQVLWQDHKHRGFSEQETRREFVLFLRSILAEPDDADAIVWCESCNIPATHDEYTVVDGGGYACERCLDEYYFKCRCCEEWCGNDYYNSTLHGSSVCDGCAENHYTYCEDCEGYYHDDYSADHVHDDGSGCCESPVMDFTIRNDGNPELAADTRVTVTLPGGDIDDEGQQRIYDYLFRNTCRARESYDDEGKCLGYVLASNYKDAQVDKTVYPDIYQARDAADAFNQKMRQVATLVLPDFAGYIGNKVQTRDGNYAKRLSRAAHQMYQARIMPAVLSEVGNIAAAHSSAADFAIEVTRDLNQSAEDFYHEDSCWWQSYYASRCALKTNGGFGLRTFEDSGDGDERWAAVTGRAWVMPLRLQNPGFDHALTPTFETTEPDAFVVFNGYGKLSGYTAARIMAHMAGWTYRKIAFSCSPMFINNGTAYLVAPEEIATHYTDGSLMLTVEQHSTLHIEEANAAITETEKEPAHVA